MKFNVEKTFLNRKNGYFNYIIGTGMFNANNNKRLSAILKEHFLELDVCPR